MKKKHSEGMGKEPGSGCLTKSAWHLATCNYQAKGVRHFIRRGEVHEEQALCRTKLSEISALLHLAPITFKTSLCQIKALKLSLDTVQYCHGFENGSGFEGLENASC